RALMHDWDIASLSLLHEAGLAALPWELFRTGSMTWARSFPMARHPILREPPKRRPYRRRRGDKLRLVIVRDDSGDLPGTNSETRRIREELQHLSEELEVKEFGQQDNSVDVRSSIKRCQILHFAGHVIFPENSGDLSDSGWLLKGNPDDRPSTWDLLRPGELRQIWKDAPLLVFANGCQSAAAKPLTRQQRANSQGAVDLAQACLSAGVSAYIGAVWKAPDNVPTGEFAAIIYRLLAAGLTVSGAMLAARDEIARRFGEEDLTWARYVVCGDPFTRLPFDTR
ncbi:MAG: CHAT domain-containing protein, partial [Candidatus Solibacter sp.]|nr:CHAT domain-containing protein [Candidatus Solibacter sp.]